MFKFGLAGSIALLASLSLAGEVQFSHDEKAAFAHAKSSHKLVMVDFYTDWCGWCKRLDAGAYKDAKVAELSRKFVPLKTDAEKEGKELAKKYKINGFPTILFLEADGTQVAKLVGYQPAPDFANTLLAVCTIKRDWNALMAKVKKDQTDGTACAKLCALYPLTDKPSLVDGKPAVSEWISSIESSKYEGPWLAKAYLTYGDELGEANKADESKAAYEKAEAVATDPADKTNALMNQYYWYRAKKDNKAALAILDRLSSLPNATAEWVAIANQSRKQLESAVTNNTKG